MILYIAGPMTGLPDLNYPLFNRVQALLETAGYKVLNPARQAGGLTWKQYMQLGLTDVFEAEGVALLDHWNQSKGARMEHHVARELGLRVEPWTYWAEH